MRPDGTRDEPTSSWSLCADRPDWGVGQVQSVIGQRITVNFENAGKLLINGAVITLEPLDDTDNPEQ
jgi:hypothetical protein